MSISIGDILSSKPIRMIVASIVAVLWVCMFYFGFSIVFSLIWMDDFIYVEDFVKETGACISQIEEKTEHNHKWTDRWFETKFKFIRRDYNSWNNVYVSNKLMFQNDYGTWHKVSYKCYYNFDTAYAEFEVTEDKL